MATQIILGNDAITVDEAGNITAKMRLSVKKDVEISGRMHSATALVDGETRTSSARIDDAGSAPSLGTDSPTGKNYGSGVAGSWCGTPDIWLKIKVNGTRYVFPGYTEAP